MKKFLILVTVTIIVLSAFAALTFWWKSVSSAVSNSPESVRFVIVKGSPAEKIGEDLYKNGLIKSPFAFKLYLQITDKSRNINSGEFMISPDMSLAQVVETLGQNPTEIWVTIPEGLRREEIAEKVANELGLTEKSIFVEEFLISSEDLEGMLFPDTYLLPPDVSAQNVVDLLNTTFERKFLQATEGSDTEISKDDATIMASIIEREAITKEERPIVSGILWNRLEIGMPLQVDASVQYVWGTIRCEGELECDWWIPPTRADLDVDSNFNTYVVNTLPPAPIANPGYDSIYAALHPAETEYFYYIHDKNGLIRYARNLEEHNRNVANYLN